MKADRLLEIRDPKSLRPKITQEMLKVIQHFIDKKISGWRVGIMSPGDIGGYGDTDGFCDYHNRKLLFKRYQLVDTQGTAGLVVHEVAHALTPGDAHGAKWIAKDKELGNSSWGHDLNLAILQARKPYEAYYRTFTNVFRGWTE